MKSMATWSLQNMVQSLIIGVSYVYSRCLITSQVLEFDILENIQIYCWRSYKNISPDF